MCRTFYSLTPKPFSRQAAQMTPVVVQEVAADHCLEPALISSAVKPPVLETDRGEEVLGALARMIEEGDDPSRTFSGDFKKERGARTL